MPKIVEVYINRPTNQLHRKLIYLVDEAISLPGIGSRVYVPIGRSQEEAIVVGYKKEEEYTLIEENGKYFVLNYDNKPRIQMKFVIKVLDKDPWYTTEMLASAKEISRYFLCSIGEALSLFTINKKVKNGYKRPTHEVLSYNELFEEYDFGRKKRQKEIVELLKSEGPLPIEILRKQGFSSATIRACKELPCVNVTEEYKDTVTKYKTIDEEKTIPLTLKQKECVDKIEQSMQELKNEEFLLHGVTGSGKTQVYIKLAQKCLQMGKSAIILVPEIGLTYQIVKRFVNIFGDEVVVFHSQLTVEERYNNWERLRRGDSHIIIGARSAIFAPLESIGLIVLDEEHDASYKDWDNSHYHARTVAKIRAKAHNCPLVLGSATPTIETYYKALQGEITLLEMPERIHHQSLPKVNIIDMKEELFFGNRSVFSDALRNLIETTLKNKEQMILMLNRRGYSTFVLCRDCGEPINCPHCDTSLIYHKANDNMRCHYCEYTESVPRVCPKCGSKKIKFFGSGTQKVEELLRSEFSMARVARLDLDVKKKKGAVEEILEDFSKGKYDILLGTQIVSKGHDFPNVTAVGVLTADSTLNIPNYTAAETAFSLFTQTAGRAGRGDKEGKVIIQTYNPSHYAIIYSRAHDYKGFYNKELEYRKPLLYPPFGQMINMTLQGKVLADIQQIGEKIVNELTEQFPYNKTSIEVFGPYQDMLIKVRDKYRLSITIKGKNLEKIKQYIMDSWIFEYKGIKINVDPI